MTGGPSAGAASACRRRLGGPRHWFAHYFFARYLVLQARLSGARPSGLRNCPVVFDLHDRGKVIELPNDHIVVGELGADLDLPAERRDVVVQLADQHVLLALELGDVRLRDFEQLSDLFLG
jgi:hypothetical protein